MGDLGEGAGGCVTFFSKSIFSTKVLAKHIPFEIVLRDQSVSELYIQDKIARQSSFNTGRTLISQLEEVLHKPLERGFLQDDVLVMPIENPDEERPMRLAGGYENFIVNNRIGGRRCVFPSGFSLQSYVLMNHTVDRGSVGSAFLNFCLSLKVLWALFWGIYHDMWNSCKTSAKATATMWKRIVEFSSIANMNHGPFRSSAWGQAKRETLTHVLETETTDSPAFREAAIQQAEFEERSTSAMDWDYWWKRVATIRSCLEAGLVCKWARWHSIEECWLYFKKEIWLLKYVLGFMNPNHALDLVRQESTQMFDADLAEQMTSSKNSLIARAPGHITQDLVDSMEIFCGCTEAIRQRYKHLTTEVKTPEQGRKETIHLVNHAWDDECKATMRQSLCNRELVVRVCGTEYNSARSLKNASLLASFTFNLIAERAIRELPQLLQYPGVAASVLDEDPACAGQARVERRRDLAVLLEGEKKARLGDPVMVRILACITWKRHAIVRLFLECVEREADGPITNESDSNCIAEAMVTRCSDEKGPEDVHQHIRDLTRARRHKHVTMAAIMDQQTRSGVLEARGISGPVVTHEAIAAKAWQSIKDRAQSKMRFTAQPEHWPNAMQAMLNPKLDWPSPTVVGMANSLCAWSWMQQLHDLRSLFIAEAWWSRLLSRLDLVVDQREDAHCIVLYAGGTS